ncbi:hypothetical protein L0F63_004426, partial [Massospora cicadina]
MEPSCGYKLKAVVNLSKMIKQVHQGVSTNLDAVMQAYKENADVKRQVKPATRFLPKTPEAYLMNGAPEWEVEEIVASHGDKAGFQGVQICQVPGLLGLKHALDQRWAIHICPSMTRWKVSGALHNPAALKSGKPMAAKALKRDQGINMEIHMKCRKAAMASLAKHLTDIQATNEFL